MFCGDEDESALQAGSALFYGGIVFAGVSLVSGVTMAVVGHLRVRRLQAARSLPLIAVTASGATVGWRVRF